MGAARRGDGGWVHGYGQYCPVALGAEIFAERWTPIIVRNLMLGCERFGEILEGAPGLSRSLLSQRLRSLERDGVLTAVRPQAGHPTYHLTEAGHDLGGVCLALGAWGARWREAQPHDLDPYVALWMLARLIDPETLPQPRVVVRFDLTDGAPPHRYWVVATHLGNEVCAQPPGFDEDGEVLADTRSLIDWHTGRIPLAKATRQGGMTVTAPRWVYRLLVTWGGLSPFASIAPMAREEPGEPADRSLVE